MKLRFLTVLSLAAVAISGSAQAIDLTFSGMSLPDAQTASISVNGSSFTSVYAGQLNFATGSSTLGTYCADALSFLNGSSHTYSETNLALTSATNLGIAGTILANSQGSALTAAQQAGLQLAIWEALYDGGSSFNAGGNFSVSGASAETLGYASQYYSSYCVTPTNCVTYFGTNQSGGQSQMTAVPEPMTIAALGMGSLALLRRRRQKSA